MLLAQLPYLILGENAIIPYHDQLDGELIAYIYQAKYLFSGQSTIPEFLCGAGSTALCPPAPLAVLLFRILPSYWALLALQTIGQVTAYAGMFLLADRLTDRKWIPLITALLYGFLPFLPIYGLSQFGIPMLLLCAYKLYRGEHRIWSLLYVALYGALSSLVLCGFACLAVWGIAIAVAAVRRTEEKSKKQILGLASGFVVLLGVYVIENAALIGQMLGLGESFVSHKSEYVLSGGNFFSILWDYLKYNGEHGADGHLWIACLCAVLLVILLPFLKKASETIRRSYKGMLSVLGLICIFCAAAALWDSAWGVAIRVHLGTLGAFQFSRVLWLVPVLWQIELVFCLETLWSAKSWRKWAGYGISVILLAMAAITTLKSSPIKANLMQLIKTQYNAMSYADYLGIGVMEQAEELIAAQEGLEKEQYRVASLGIDPAAALHQGFYCVDGYSNNYDVEYKHRFRGVIAPELERSDYLREYYDNWGNRCYLFSAECAGYYTIEKNGFFYSDLQIDTEALKNMGCDYILSAAYIANAQEKNLLQLNETGLETADSYYRIFVYKIR